MPADPFLTTSLCPSSPAYFGIILLKMNRTGCFFGAGRRALSIAFALLVSLPAQATEARHGPARLRTDAETFLRARIATTYPEYRADVAIGGVDPRLRLASCPAPVHFLPSSSHLWGSGSLGIRCDTPHPWSLYLSYRVRLTGPSLVARHPLQGGQTLTARDVEDTQVEFNADPGSYLSRLEPSRDAQVRRSVPAGTPLTVSLLRYPPIIRPGQRVRVISEGRGFQIGQEGVAQNSAGVGEIVRLKTPSGRIVQGVAQTDATVRINP